VPQNQASDDPHTGESLRWGGGVHRGSRRALHGDFDHGTRSPPHLRAALSPEKFADALGITARSGAAKSGAWAERHKLKELVELMLDGRMLVLERHQAAIEKVLRVGSLLCDDHRRLEAEHDGARGARQLRESPTKQIPPYGI
jgi:hypothetical protein